LNKKILECKGMKRKKAEHALEQSAGTSTGVPEPDQGASGDAGTGRENTVEQDGGQGSTPNPRLVERMTGLRGLSIGKGRVAQSTLRKRTEQDLRLPDAEIPYFKTEKAVMDLICSLLERQDRMNESIFLKLNDLAYRVDDVEYRLDDLEGCLESAGIKRSGTDKEGRK
jgi:hypothetical protein